MSCQAQTEVPARLCGPPVLLGREYRAACLSGQPLPARELALGRVKEIDAHSATFIDRRNNGT
jgi:hypothetical protein